MNKIMNKKTMKKVLSIVLTIVMTLGFCVIAYAGGNAATEPMKRLQSLFEDLVTAIGFVVALICLVILFATWNSHDNSQRVMAFMGLAGGILIAVAPRLLTWIING